MEQIFGRLSQHQLQENVLMIRILYAIRHSRLTHLFMYFQKYDGLTFFDQTFFITRKNKISLNIIYIVKREANIKREKWKTFYMQTQFGYNALLSDFDFPERFTNKRQVIFKLDWRGLSFFFFCLMNNQRRSAAYLFLSATIFRCLRRREVISILCHMA